MANDKTKNDYVEQEDSQEERGGNAASRARNKTVMLTSDITGQVRAQLQSKSNPSHNPVADLLPPINWGAQSQGNFAGKDKESAQEPAAKDSGSNLKNASSVEMNNEGSASPGNKRPTRSFSAPELGTTEQAAPVNSASKGTMAVQAKKKSRIAAFLVSFDKDEFGDVVEVRSGRWLLTSRASEHGDQIIINDESISPLHAIIRATSDGKVQVLDQLSEFGTGVTKVGSKNEEDISGAMVTLDHGDIVRFGKRKFVVCTVPSIEG
jgi:hypothetical protein